MEKSIVRKEVFLCVGDKKYIYTLPVFPDKIFLDEINKLGNLKEIKTRKGIVWLLENQESMMLRFGEKSKDLVVSFQRKSFKEAISSLDKFLTEYFHLSIAED